MPLTISNMVDNNPAAYMLCGLPGSGKTTYSKELEKQGAARFSIDESILDRYGKYAIDFSDDKYAEYKKNILNDLKKDITSNIKKGKSVVLDFGLWKRKDRERFRELVEAAGAEPKLIYFKAEPKLLIERLHSRNQHQASNLPKVNTELFSGVVDRFEEPTTDENPEIIQQ